MFTKGQLIECIKVPRDGGVTKGAIYTVAWSGFAWNLSSGLREPAVMLVEASPEPLYSAFRAIYFRPLQDSRLDVFRAMLVQTPAPVFVHNGDDGA